jgi:hypothetical protein
MEHGPNTNQRDANPAPGALADLCPNTPQQSFDLAPSKIGGCRLCEDPGQSSSVSAVHPIMISEMDIAVRSVNDGLSATDRLQCGEHAFLVGTHQPRIPSHVGGKDRGETAGLAHPYGTPARARPTATVFS